MEPPFPIARVENFDRWFEITGEQAMGNGETVRVSVSLRSMTAAVDAHSSFYVDLPPAVADDLSTVQLAILRFLYGAKVGHIACFWFGPRDDEYAAVTSTPFVMPMEFKYANIKFRELFEFYTTANGSLQLPRWKHLKHALDEFLVENPRTKYHPLRVEQFIDENGIDSLEAME